MAFDPLKYGATPVIKSALPSAGGSFNPADYGATPVDQKAALPKVQTDTVQTPKPILPAGIGTQDSNSILGKTNQILPSIANKTVDIWKNTIQKIPKDIQEGAADVQKGGVLNTAKGLLKGSVRTAADTAGAIFAPVSATVGTVLEKTGVQAGLEHVANWLVGKSRISDQKWFQNFAISHPNAEEDFNRGLTLLMAKGENGEIDPKQMIEDIKSGKFVEDAKKTVEPVRQKAENIKQQIGEKVGEHYSDQQAADFEKTRMSVAKNKAEVTGKILQAEPDEVAAGQRALRAVDLKGIKNYKDLGSRFQTKVNENTASVDSSLAKDTTSHKSEELTQTNPTKTDYTQKAIDQLKDFYSKTEDADSLSKIQEVEARYKDKGLTAKEINDLARQHGKDLNAYNQNGQLASGLSKQAAENVRTGVKETARSLMPDENTRAVDKETADLLKAKDMADDMHTKVQKLQNTIQKAGFLKEAASWIGKAINIGTGRVGEGFIKSFFPDFNNLGADTKLNPVQLQENLAKNIKFLDKLNDMTPEEAVKELEKQKNGQKKPALPIKK